MKIKHNKDNIHNLFTIFMDKTLNIRNIMNAIKRYIILIISIFLSCEWALSQDFVTLSTSSTGSLKEKLNEEDWKEISKLKVVGPVNAEDISWVRRFAIADSGKLKAIDLSETQLFAIGDESFSECTNLESIILPEIITQIGKSAFGGCKKLKEVKIPSKVTQIGEYAFAECEELKSIKLPESVTEVPAGCFADCKQLETVNIPSNATSLGKEAFARCINLKTIEIPASISSIGGAVFAGCYELAFIKVSPNNKKYCATAGGVLYSKDGKHILQYPAGKKGDIYTVPQGVTRIGMYAFSGSKHLEKITIPSTCTWVGYGSFYECEKLKSIELPAQIDRIGEDLFYNCANLENITIPENATFIGPNAFHGCVKLRQINIPKKVGRIGKQAFFGCRSLERIEIPSGIDTIHQSTFVGCRKLAEIKLPETIVCIEEMAFAADSSLKSIKLPNGLKTIGGGAFGACMSLEEIHIPESVNMIDYAAFVNCRRLRNLTIPASTDSVGISAFAGCDSLMTLTVKGNNPPKSNVLAAYAITDTLQLNVPSSSEEAYHTALGWKEIKHINNKRYEVEHLDAAIDLSDKFDIESMGVAEDVFLVYSSLSGAMRDFSVEMMEDNTVYKVSEVDTQAEYPGSVSALQSYLKNGVHYPSHAKGKKGVVEITFIIEKNGKVSHLKVEQSQGNELDAEAVAAVNDMQTWKAAEKDGKKVRQEGKVSIRF